MGQRGWREEDSFFTIPPLPQTPFQLGVLPGHRCRCGWGLGQGGLWLLALGDR